MQRAIILSFKVSKLVLLTRFLGTDIKLFPEYLITSFAFISSCGGYPDISIFKKPSKQRAKSSLGNSSVKPGLRTTGPDNL